MRKRIISLITIITLLSTMIPTVALGATAGAIAKGGTISYAHIYSSDGTKKGEIQNTTAELGDKIVIAGTKTSIYWCSNGAFLASTPSVVGNSENEATIEWGTMKINDQDLWQIEGTVTGVVDTIYENRNLQYIATVSHTMTYNSKTYNVVIGSLTIALDNPMRLAQFEIGKIKSISAGGNHSLLLTENGEVYAMGYNKSGQLGLGDTTDRTTPERIDISGIKAIAAGYYHSLLLTENGEVYAMGNNSCGQLGLGDTTNRTTPEKIDISGVIKIATGYYHSLLLTEDYEVYAMGYNEYGQLGLGDTTDRTTPEKVNIRGLRTIAAGRLHSLLLTDDGYVYAMGFNEYGQLGLGNTADRTTPEKVNISGIEAIAAGENHSLLLEETGEVYAMGHNEYGQLGLGDTTNRTSPERVNISGIKTIASGEDYSLLLTENGVVYAMGVNNYGQLGLGDTTYRLSPEGVNIRRISEISAGGYHSLLLTENDEVYAMGANNYGQLGLGDTTSRSTSPTNLGFVPDLIADKTIHIIPHYLDFSDQIDESTFKYAFDKKYETTMKSFDVYDGIYLKPNFNGKYYLRVYARANWGDDINRVYEFNVINAPNEPPKVELIGDTEPKIITLGACTYYLTNEGTVWVSGENRDGQLGTGDAEDVYTVEQIKLGDGETPLSNIKEIITENDRAYYLTNEGTVWVSGENYYGQLGTGDTKDVYTVKQIKLADGVTPLNNIKEIITENDSTYYLTNEGTVWVSGDNDFGQLGTGDTKDVYTVKQIKLGDGKTLLSNIKEIITDGYTGTYYLTNEGTVWVSGENSCGQLGTGDTEDVYTVEQIKLAEAETLLSNIKEIIKEYRTTYYRTNEGTVWVSGETYDEDLEIVQQIMLSDGETPLSNIEEIITSEGSTYYLTKEGTVWVSGYNTDGQLGTGDTEDVYTVEQIKLGDGETLLSNIKEIISNENSTYYLTKEGTVWVSGDNSDGQLGTEISGDYVYTVEQIKLGDGETLLSNIKEIITSEGSTYYLTKEGTVWVSGDNSCGQLGTGDTEDVYTVEKIPKLILPYKKDYPMVKNLSIKDDALDEVESSAYAFVSQAALDANGGEVPSGLWVKFDVNVPAVFLAPSSNDTYYLYVKLQYAEAEDGELVYRDGELHETTLGPFVVTGIKGESDQNSYSYVSGDIHTMKESNAEFNLIFVPSQDMTLGNTDNHFTNVFTEEKLNIQVLDKAGNILNTNSKAIFNVYKNNGMEITEIGIKNLTPNYVFTKRDEGSEIDNMYILRVGIGADVMLGESGTEYQIQFNGLKGLSTDGTNQTVTLNSHPFTMKVYLTDLLPLT